MILIIVFAASSWGVVPMCEEKETVKPFKFSGAQRLAGHEQHLQPIGFIARQSSCESSFRDSF